MILRLLTCSLFVMTVLTGCGLKGSLYLPEERAKEVSSQSSPTSPSTEQQKKPRSSSPSSGETQTPATPTDTTREQNTPTTDPPGT